MSLLKLTETYLHGVSDTLAAAGFEHYEISSFARSGKRCQHNQVYWANHAYFGFGMGAARYVEGTRELNTRDLDTYLRRVLNGQPATFAFTEAMFDADFPGHYNRRIKSISLSVPAVLGPYQNLKATLQLTANFIVDLSYVLLDPRLKRA